MLIDIPRLEDMDERTRAAETERVLREMLHRIEERLEETERKLAEAINDGKKIN